MKPIQIILVEPDVHAARTLSACIRAAIPGVHIDHAPIVARLRSKDLRSASIVLCADAPPRCDALEVIEEIQARRGALPIAILMDRFDSARAQEVIEWGACECLPRSGMSDATLAFAIEKCLAIARLEHDQFRLHAGLTRSLAEFIQRNRQLAGEAARLEMMASTDPLTRLNNRWWLKERLDIMFAEAVRYGSDLSCMMIDLDSFKSVNDRYGHQQGDRVLALTGELIKSEIRTTDAAARYGGDEFIVLMPRSNSSTAIHLAARLQQKFEARLRKAVEVATDCSMCIGVACVSISRPGAAEVLIRHADMALYAAKQIGANSAMILGPDGVTPLDARSFAA